VFLFVLSEFSELSADIITQHSYWVKYVESVLSDGNLIFFMAILLSISLL